MEEWTDPLNPFNSLKALVWADRFEALARGEIPAPVSVTIDPSNVCNISCKWCHSADFRAADRSIVNEDKLLRLANAMGAWSGVKAVCIAGGGEPFTNRATPALIRHLVANGLQVGLITNGTLLKGDVLEAARLCRWVGFSIDSATPWTYVKLKGYDKLESVLRGISSLAGKGPAIGYKFLIHPENIGELYAACYIAREMGVNDFHARPLYSPELVYTDEQVKLALSEIGRARADLEGDHFRIYGIRHKFGSHFERRLPEVCKVTPLAGLVFQADGRCTICCDKRGDEEAILCRWEDIREVWGSSKHRELMARLVPSKHCHRRCTFSPYAEILDKVFVKDSMCRAFI